MIPSGTHAEDVPPEAFDGRPDMAVRFERPDPRLAAYFTDYHMFDSEGPDVIGATEWTMPTGPNLRFYMHEHPINVWIGSRAYTPTPHAALYGPNGRSYKVQAFGGCTIGIGISPLGWARLFPQPASEYRDRIVPLDQVMPAAFSKDLYELLKASDHGLEVKGVIDAFLLEHIGEPHPDEPVIRRLMGLLLDEKVAEIAEIADQVGLPQQKLRQVALRYFGFPPKRLLRRARFLRSLLRMYAAGEPDYTLIARSYFDSSHFLRDADEFLGMTPRRFMALQTPYLRRLIRARTAVFGVPAQTLHAASPGEPAQP